MSIMYKVLWVDDQYEDPSMIQFAIEAENNGLYLEGFTSFEEAFENLTKKINEYDLILLDGLFFEKKNQEKGTEDEKGIGMAIAKINELKNRKVFPWFVLSGKDKFTKGENSLLIANQAKCFDKTNPSDVVRLFKEMKEAALDQPEIQIKHKYKDVLDSCSNSFLGYKNYSRLFELIQYVESDSKIKGGEDKLTTVRKVVEGLFHTLGRYEIIPSQMVGQKGWINGSSKFLSGNHNDYILISEIVPPILAFNLSNLLEIIQDGSHAYGDLKYEVDQYIKGSKSDYFFRSCVYALFDILISFKGYIATNQDATLNKKRWATREIAIEENFEGKLNQDSEGNYYVGDCVFPYNKVHKIVPIGTQIKIKHSTNNNNTKTKKTYPKFAVTFEEIK